MGAGNTGNALSFVNEKNSGVIRELRDMLDENDQEVPPWLNQMASYSGSRGGGRNNRGSKNFGGRDVRRSNDNNGGGQRNSGYGGGGGYGGGYGGGGYGGGGSGNFGGAW